MRRVTTLNTALSSGGKGMGHDKVFVFLDTQHSTAHSTVHSQFLHMEDKLNFGVYCVSLKP